jgi:uncharacterized protein
MSIEQNKKTALDFWAKFSVLDVDGALAYTAPDFTWWMAGKPDKFAFAGLMSKEKFLGVFSELLKLAPKGIQIEPLTLTAEGDRVAFECKSVAHTTTGRVYNNEYHFLMHFTPDGKIKQVKEYLDTMHTKEIFID